MLCRDQIAGPGGIGSDLIEESERLVLAIVFDEAEESAPDSLCLLLDSFSGRLSCSGPITTGCRSAHHCSDAQSRLSAGIELNPKRIGKTTGRLQGLDFTGDGVLRDGPAPKGAHGVSTGTQVRPELSTCSGRGCSDRVPLG